MKRKEQKAKVETRHAFELPDGQHCLAGARNGFTKLGDKVYPSPGRKDWAKRLAAERKGVTDLLESTNCYVATVLARVAAEDRSWWDGVIDDLGLSGKPEANWLQRSFTGEIVVVKPPDPPKDAKTK
jgi:hypothetical protein